MWHFNLVLGLHRGEFEKSCDKIAQPDWLPLLAIRSDERGKSLERAHLANAAPANLIADIWHARYRWFYTPIAQIDENRNRCTGHIGRIESPGVSPALQLLKVITWLLTRSSSQQKPDRKRKVFRTVYLCVMWSFAQLHTEVSTVSADNTRTIEHFN